MFLKILLVFTILFPILVSSQTKPNIVMIYIDDLGWTDVGYNEAKFYNPRFYSTPNIDKLASEGMIFNEAYANAGNCAPSRAALLSGQYAPRTGVYTVGNSARGPTARRKIIPVDNILHIKPENITFAEALKTNGYATAHMGKWHMGDNATTFPEGQGFDVNIGGNETGGPGGYFCPLGGGRPNLGDCPTGVYITDFLTDKAVEFITTNQNNPFLLYFSHYSVHSPIQSPDSLKNKYTGLPASGGHSNATYAGMLESVDNSVGRVVSTVDNLGIADRTMIIFYSDNGGFGGATKNDPLRAMKGTSYEGGIRVPFFARWTGRITAGTQNNYPILGTDLYPTFLELTNTTAPANYILDGQSIVPLLMETDTTLNREALYWHYPVYLQAQGSCCAAGGKTGMRTSPVSTIRKGDYKFMEYYEYGQLELYNIKTDISEQNNLVKTMPLKAAELRADLHQWQQDLNAFIPTEQNPGFDPNNGNEPDRADYTTWDDLLPLVKGRTQIKYNTQFEINSRGNGFEIKLIKSGVLKIYSLSGEMIKVISNTSSWIPINRSQQMFIIKWVGEEDTFEGKLLI